MNYKNKIEEIRNEKEFSRMYQYAKEENLLKYINKFALGSLNERKLKNFLIACLEERMKLTTLTSKPYKITIDPTNACNLGCELCPTGLNASSKKKTLLDFESFKKIIDEVKHECIEMHLYNWGEPTLNKNLIKMLRYCSENKIWTGISTNFSLNYKDDYLEEMLTSGLDFLHIDVDGLDQEVYSKYRRKGNFELVVQNILKVKLLKEKLSLKKPIIEIAMLAMRQNEHQHKRFMEMKNYFGADEIKINKIQHNPNMDEKWLPENKDLVYKTYEGGNASSNSGSDEEIIQCHWPWSGIVINADGSVNPCCIVDDPNSDFDYVQKNSVYTIWNSEEYVSARAEFGDKNKISKNTICNVCKNQTHSKRLNRVSKSFAIKL
jgi:MoaA/NifB/PqqE/SkfB family radical SAM enzyme